MKRVWICSLIIALILIISSAWLVVLCNKNERLSQLIDEAVESVRSGDSDTATRAIDDLCKYWESFYATASVFERSTPLDNVSDSVAKLKSLYENGSEEFYSECETIRCAADRIFKSNLPFVPDSTSQ